MERVGEQQSVSEQQQQVPRPTKGPCDWMLSRQQQQRQRSDEDCWTAVRDVKDYCRDRNMPVDLYRPAVGRCGGGGGGGGGKFRLTDLISELHRVFAEDRVNVEYVQYLMESYRSDPAEWLKYAKFNKFRYTRNLVDAGNGKFNLMVLCWGEGNGSSIHNHPDSDCVMKILAGQLTEVRFAWPEKNDDDDDDDDDDQQLRPMRELGRTVLETDGICHINGRSTLITITSTRFASRGLTSSVFRKKTFHAAPRRKRFFALVRRTISPDVRNAFFVVCQGIVTDDSRLMNYSP